MSSCGDDQVRMSTYTVGDESWKTHTFTCPNASDYCVDIVVYMEGEGEGEGEGKGSFYCFSKEGLLSSFNVGTQEWKPLTRKTCPTPNGRTSETPLCNYYVE